MVCIYDSGVGGLSSLVALRRAAPNADIVYLGDTARVPYGTKDGVTVRRYAAEALDLLADLCPEAILVACGTVSTVALPALVHRYPVRVLGIVEAGIAAALSSGPHRIAVLGTEATVRSGTFAARLSALAPSAEVRSLACPLFVALAEAGMVDGADAIPRLVVERTLAPLFDFSPEVILLACTHFPWLSCHIARLFPGARLVDCGAAAVELLVPTLRGRETGDCRFLVTDGADAFLRTYRRITGDTEKRTVMTVTL